MKRYWTKLVHPRLLAGEGGEEMGHAIVDTMIEEARYWCDRHGYVPTGGPEIRVDHEVEVHSRMTAIEVALKIEPRWDGVWGDLRRALDEDGLLPDRDRPSPVGAPSSVPVGTVHVGIDPAAKTVGEMAWFTWDGHVWVKLPGGRVIDPETVGFDG